MTPARWTPSQPASRVDASRVGERPTSRCGDGLSTFSFKPAADAGVVIDGKKVPFHDLKVGEKISFWVSADRLTASEQPGDTAESWSVLPPQ